MDLRLVWIAVSTWLSAAITIGLESHFNPIWTLVWVSACGLGIRAVGSVGTQVRINWQVINKYLLLGILLGACVATLRVLPLALNPIHKASENNSVVSGVGYLTSDPVITNQRSSLDWSSRELLRVTIRVEEISWHGESSKLRIPVQVFAQDQEVIDLLANAIPGAKIEFVGKLSPAQAGRPVAANLLLIAPPKISNQVPRFQVFASVFRSGLKRALVGTSEAAKGLVPGLALGDSSQLDRELAADMKLAGLTHLIAVSGTNVTLLIVLVLTILQRTRFSNTSRYLLAAIALGAFVVLVRPQPSVLRATVMGLVALFAGYAGTRKSPLPALCFAILALVLIDPWLAVSYGFALSVAATFGLLLWSKKLLAYFDRVLPRVIPKWLVEVLVVTICAQAAVFPLMVALGSRISLISIPANLFAVPLAEPTMVLGLIAAIISPVSPPAAHLVAVFAAITANLIAKIAHFCAHLDWLTIPWPHGKVGVATSLVSILLSGHAVLRWRYLSQSKRNQIASIAIVALVLIWVSPTISLSNWPNPDWVMVSCDVGQGDAAVIRTGRHEGVVIDVGSDPDLVDKCLKRLEITSIPLLLLTHFHADHVGGLSGALRGRSIGQIRISPLAEPPATTEFVMATLARMHLKASVLTYPEQFRISDVDFKCIWPSKLILGQGSDPNNASVALLVTVSGKHILMSGDIEPEAQNAIMQALGSVQVDVIKVPHHGSRNQSAPFAAWVHARVALISVGKNNDYGHPAPETISLYELLGSKVYRTDLQGDLAILVHDGELRVATQK